MKRVVWCRVQGRKKSESGPASRFKRYSFTWPTVGEDSKTSKILSSLGRRRSTELVGPSERIKRGGKHKPPNYL
jgi:hypothetical protein